MVARTPAGIAVALCLLAGTASAQIVLGNASSPGITQIAHPPEERPEADAPRTESSHPSRPAEQTSTGRDLFLATPDTYSPRYDARPGQPRHVTSPYFFPYAVPFYIPSPAVADLPAPRVRTSGRPRESVDRTESIGYLRLDVQPSTAQVFVDGLYMGVASDFADRSGPPLEARSHRIEVRAEGFETRTFDVNIRPGQLLTYRAVLERTEAVPPQATVAANAPVKTLYVIPRCYAGDVIPRAEQLPDGCDVAAIRVVRPD